MEEERAGLPTLLVVAVLLSSLSYFYLPSQEDQPSPLSWVLDHWLLGPALLGAGVTLVTLAVLAYDSAGGPKEGGRLARLVAVMNGGLMFLYGVFYSLNIRETGVQ